MSLDKTGWRILDFKVIQDERGKLIALEGQKEIPFDVKRIYYIFDTSPNAERGFHAHKKLQQVAVCIHGSCTFVLDNGKNRSEVIMNTKDRGLYIEGIIWREMKDFSKDAVVIVFADEVYDESDYIKDYQSFISYVSRRC